MKLDEEENAMERRDKINYYLDLAEIVGQRGTCLRRPLWCRYCKK